jgi:holo-[acyl-carrier protein] synthase
MVLGVGFDVEDLEDFGRTMDQSGEAFLNRVYTEREIEYCRSQPHARQSYAARYCAKEAAMKALGIAGMEGLKWHDFEIVCAAAGGSPQLLVTGLAASTAKTLRVRRFFVSLSHSRSAAGAVVVAEGAGSIPTRQVVSRNTARTNSAKGRSARKRRAQ